MVCDRCKMVVKSELEKFGLHAVSVDLGEVETAGDIDKLQLEKLNDSLKAVGFELIDDKRSRLTERIKTIIIDLVHANDNFLNVNLSDHIVSEIGQDYSYISNLFSQSEATTIEQYYILQKIEKVKELLTYDEFTLSEIAFRMNYSSPSHLSKQFKKVTGLTPTIFRNLKEKNRLPLDSL